LRLQCAPNIIGGMTHAVFLNRSRELRKGQEALRQELAPFAAVKARFDFEVTQVVRSGDIALMHTRWNVSSPHPMSLYAIDVARRQPDGTWRWLIGDPFTLERQAASQGTR
jgi:ketosteroid isomerase-like protein